jgi:L-ribulose-5-phosphate 3-epimerase
MTRRNIRKAMMLPAALPTAAIAGRFRLIKAAGFEGLEARGGMNQEAVLKARDETGLLIPSVCCETHWTHPLSDPDPAVRAKGLAGLETALRDAQVYGATSVLLVPAVVTEQVSYDAAYARSQAEIRKALPSAEKLGVKIAIENVWNRFLLSPLEAVRYVDEFSSPMVGWHFDVGNVVTYGWPEQWIRTLGKRILKLHIKEYSRQKQENEAFKKGFDVEYLQGDNDWPAVMKALDEIAYQGWAIAEPAFHPSGIGQAERLRQIAGKMDVILGMAGR